MSDNLEPSPPPNQLANEPPRYRSRYEERQARRAERRERRMEYRQARGMGGAWIGGAVLILLGMIFLLQNMGVMFIANWWALFILIPAVGAFGRAWNVYRFNGGRLTPAARSSLIGGLALTMIAAVFLLNLDFGIAWPILLILLGVGLLLNTLLPA